MWQFDNVACNGDRPPLPLATVRAGENETVPENEQETACPVVPEALVDFLCGFADAGVTSPTSIVLVRETAIAAHKTLRRRAPNRDVGPRSLSRTTEDLPRR